MTAVSKRVADFVSSREKINKNKLIVIYNAVNDSFISNENSLESFCNHENTVKIVCVASLNFRKGHEDLLEALKILLRKGRRLELHLLGDGKNRVNLENLIQNFELSHSVFIGGYISDVRRTLAGMDIGVLSSYEEGMSNALLEYMAMGLPVVTTDVGGNSEVNIAGVTGFLVPPRDPEAMARSLDKLITNPKLREEMGKMARNRIRKHFSIDKMRTTYTSFYLDKVLEKQR